MVYLTKLIIVMRKRAMQSKTNKPGSEHPCTIKLEKRLSFKALQ